MAVTSQKIADMAGVSRGTVDRAINDRGRINPEVKEKILTIAETEGYFETKKRRAARRKIGVVTQLNETQFMININKGLHEAAKILKRHNVEVLIRGTEGVDGKAQAELIDALLDEGAEGLAIMASDSQHVRDKIKAMREQGIPVITFNTDLRGSERDFFIGLDNKRSGRAGAGLMNMLTGGKGKILVITGYFVNDVDNQRVEGFMEECMNQFSGLSMLGVQSCFDKDEEVKRIICETMQSVPDLAGIFIVSGGQAGVRQAFEEIQPAQRPYVIVYDKTPDNEQLLRDDVVDFVLGQGCYQQGMQAPILLSDLLTAGKRPEKECVYTDTVINTKYNI